MFWTRRVARAFICCSLLTTVGCCYHAQHFGRKRDIGIGEIGCATCKAPEAPCDTGGCKNGSCDLGTLPVATSEVTRGNTVLSVSYREPGRGMLGRLREKIDARKTERVELILPHENVVATETAAPPALPTITTASHAILPTTPGRAATPPEAPPIMVPVPGVPKN